MGTNRLRRLGAVLFVVLFSPAVFGQSLRIYHIDVEQGDSTLLVAPNGRTLLVDSGKNGHGPRIQRVMQQAGVNQIDVYVNTHYHEDHYGGIDDLVDAGVPVLESYDRGDKAFVPTSKKKEPTFKSYQRTVGEDAIHLQRGETFALDPAMTVTCISSGGTVIGEEPPLPGTEENDMSVSLLVTFGGFRYFIGGDIHEHTEQKIADRDLAKDVDMYRANHHGSQTSSSHDFLADLSPSVVVVSNGDNGTYKHPRQATLDVYAGLNPAPRVFQTNKCFRTSPCGNVPGADIGDPETRDQDGTILVTVDHATSRYTVTFGTGTTHAFSAKAPAAPVPALASVVITSVLPNPSGDDGQLEEVTLTNKGGASVSLVGWSLADRSGLTWTLDGSVAAGQSRTLLRNGQPMSLNNAGDEIGLFDETKAERDRFSYAASVERTVIETGH